MKIQILHIVYQTKIIGGVERFLECLLSQSKNDESLLTLYHDKNNLSIHNSIDSLKEKNKSYNPLLLIYFTLKRAYIYKRYCVKNDIRICFSHGDSLNISTIISKLLFRNTSKVVIFLHNSLSFYNNTGSSFYKYLFSYLYPKADKLITISAEMKYELESKGYTNTALIYNPLEFKKIKTLQSESIGEYQDLFDNKKYTFITSGRLEEVKNISFLISCFKEHHKLDIESQFIIIGDGSMSSKLNKESGDNLDIHLIPFQGNIYKYLEKADCFLFSSLNEGFGRVLIESLGSGTPVLTHDFKYGAKEIIRNSFDFKPCREIEIHENGILTPYLDSNKFITAMGVMKKNQFDKRKIFNNIKKYSVENSILSYKQIIKDVSP